MPSVRSIARVARGRSLAALVALLGSAAGCDRGADRKSKQSEESDESDKPKSKTQAADDEAREAARASKASYTAVDMAKVYAINEVKGDEQFAGKWAKVYGKVGRVGKDDSGAVLLFLYGYCAGMVPCKPVTVCVMGSKPEGVGSLVKGDRVMVLGKIKGISSNNIVVEECTMEESYDK